MVGIALGTRSRSTVVFGHPRLLIDHEFGIVQANGVDESLRRAALRIWPTIPHFPTHCHRVIIHS
jgi:hypothetical protein